MQIALATGFLTPLVPIHNTISRQFHLIPYLFLQASFWCNLVDTFKQMDNQTDIPKNITCTQVVNMEIVLLI